MITKMLERIILIACVFYVVVNAKTCKKCEEKNSLPVCGADGKTYPSFCHLILAECEGDVTIGFKCDGTCPCDPVELSRMDEKTVKELAKLRKDIQLEGHEEELDNGSDNIVTFEILDSQNLKTLEGEEDQGYLQTEYDGCPSAERAELPRRLIDWFHVLKTNEREEKYKSEGIVKEPVLKEMKFIDAKLKAMYARLACGDNDEEVEKEVCLPSVKWMFYHMDTNKDDNLSAMELLEIEEINNEHCIKPFLRACDRNNDKKVVLKEFCKCLCLTPPCTHALESIPTVLINGKPRPFPGLFTPKCDEDGFFMPMQRNKRKGEYWCVDRNGAEVYGSRNTTLVKCGLNTRVTTKYQKLIPFNMEKENEPTSA